MGGLVLLDSLFSYDLMHLTKCVLVLVACCGLQLDILSLEMMLMWRKTPEYNHTGNCACTCPLQVKHKYDYPQSKSDPGD